MKNIIIALVALVVVGGGAYLFLMNNEPATTPTPDLSGEPALNAEENTNTIVINEDGDNEPEEPETPSVERIGTSADENAITAYHFGNGDREVLFIGGMHGGYSFNTAALGFELVDYFEANEASIPDNLTVTVIPVLNPDGLELVTGETGRFDASTVTDTDEVRVPGRFNGNNVDLNRNFDCEWDADATWQSRAVSGGDAPFSEPEAAAIRDYVAANNPVGAVVYYSQAGGVYSATCNGDTISPAVAELTNVYADASGYPAFEEFDYYEITGDMVNWMTAEGITAISVLLSDHENTEFSKNRAGVLAVLEHLAE